MKDIRGRRIAMVNNESFDHAYMHALFDLGIGQGRQGHAWMRVPPKLARRVCGSTFGF